MSEQLEEQIKILKEYNQKIVELFSFSVSGAAGHLYDYDLYAAGAANRAIAIINSFSLLLPDEPFGAIALIRIHLDTLLRVNAPALAEDRLSFVRDVMGGAVIQKIDMHPQIALDNNLQKGSKLTDRNLVNVLKQFGARIESIYNNYCDDIHLSGKTIEKAVIENNDGIHFSIGTNEFVTEEEKMQAVQDMIFISDMFASSLGAYIVHKSSMGGEYPTPA
ncbi:hypothetical protein [Dyadobacter sp. CY351]|uniref:hypothetical protein n=1 Tax=Dyadobacter sp. CY351 TaxID=2909337 RepID=UPI001F18876B|nr:hypothetical protein [Dyadobacter sp. CY351]MCF2520708.1 hypothetical protein [Dyadobacter sp. CY351]